MVSVRALPRDAKVLQEVARAWCDRQRETGRDMCDGIIFVPSRRAARALSSEFLRASDRGAVILPKILPLNALDETALFFSAGLQLPPAMSDVQRVSILSSLILKWNGRAGAPETVGGAMRLARDLAALMDEGARWEVDLSQVLPDIVEGDLAEHWRDTVEFLSIVATAFPTILAEEGMITKEARRLMLMEAQVSSWRDTPPSQPVWLVGVAFATPPLARFVQAVATLPQGRVFLTAYDQTLSDVAWDQLSSGSVSPHLGFKRLLQDIGAGRGDVIAAADQSARADYVRDAFLPADMLSDWQDILPVPEGVRILASQDEFEEARAIAAAIRDVIEVQGRTTALVTADRIQAVRVAAELKRLGIETEDSAGLLVADTPPAVFLRLVAEAFADGFSAISLVALMSHPFFTLDIGAAEARKLARALEMKVLRPLHPAAGLEHVRLSCASIEAGWLADFVRQVEAAYEPLTALPTDEKFPIGELFTRLVQVADALSGGGEEVWSGDTGGMLSAVLTEFVGTAEVLPNMPANEVPDVLHAAIHDARLRRPRNKDSHARVAIWGVLEARLQHVDTLFIGGLTEGVFPAPGNPGPWFSRPMRKAVGLPSPEDAVAEASHDFISLVQSAGDVVLCLPKRIGGAPAVPSRFVARLEALAAGRGAPLERHPASGWVRRMDTPAVKVDRPRPAPRPPAAVRPTTFSISDITVLMNDPYALYARKILKIAEVPSLSEGADPALFGTIVHDGVAAFLRDIPDFGAPGAADRLYACMVAAFPPGRPAAAVRAWWLARLRRVATWLINTENNRIASMGAPELARFETPGRWEIQGGRFIVTARADRIEARKNEVGQRVISLIDYKTGSAPSAATVENGGAPQLVIEAAMAKLGCFGEEFGGEATELAYWGLHGGAVEGKITALFGRQPDKIGQLVEKAIAQVPALLEHFAREETAFLDRPHPSRAAARGSYAGISRRAEWDVNR